MLEFVYFGACETGKGKEGSTNLVNAFHDKGADVVLGFTDSVLVNETNWWTNEFMISLSNGSTIRQAIDYADESVRNSGLGIIEYTITEETRYLVGSDRIIPCD